MLRSLLKKIKNLYEKIKNLYEKTKNLYKDAKNKIKEITDYVTASRPYLLLFFFLFNTFYLPLLIIRLSKKMLFFIIMIIFLPNEFFYFLSCSFLRFNIPKTHIFFFFSSIFIFLVIRLIWKKIKNKKIKKNFEVIKIFNAFTFILKFPKYFIKKKYLYYRLFYIRKKNFLLYDSDIKYLIYKFKTNKLYIYNKEILKKFFNFLINLFK